MVTHHLGEYGTWNDLSIRIEFQANPRTSQQIQERSLGFTIVQLVLKLPSYESIVLRHI